MVQTSTMCTARAHLLHGGGDPKFIDVGCRSGWQGEVLLISLVSDATAACSHSMQGTILY
uniref:Uncharacterized protein n=1 Tax=Physcomitrium patens TaxID=3218 RepID=A0A2K1J4F8_PHYPA|nr:hypothetical protein PHYPA_022265 [Physcomitrium patens]